MKRKPSLSPLHKLIFFRSHRDLDMTERRVYVYLYEKTGSRHTLRRTEEIWANLNIPLNREHGSAAGLLSLSAPLFVSRALAGGVNKRSSCQRRPPYGRYPKKRQLTTMDTPATFSTTVSWLFPEPLLSADLQRGALL